MLVIQQSPMSRDVYKRQEVCKATHGLIEHLDTQIDEFVLAMLVDVLYFKGTWEKEFDDYDTTDRVFYGAKGKQKVPTMRLSLIHIFV